MLRFIRSLATKAKPKSSNASADTSPLTQNVRSFSPSRHRSRRPLAEEQEVDDLDEITGHDGAPDSGEISNTRNMRMLENRTHVERLHEQAPETRVDTTEKGVTDQSQPSREPPAVVGLGITGLGNSRAFTAQEVRDGLHERQYHEYEIRTQRLRELEHQLRILNGRFDAQTTELEEEAQDLRSDVNRLRKLLWGP